LVFKIRDRLGVYWELSRPFTLLPPAIGIASGALVALGALSNYRGSGVLRLVRTLSAGTVTRNILLGALAAAVLNAASNALNQIFDLENDRINCPRRPLPSGRISPRRAWSFAAASFLVTFVLAWLVVPQGSHHFFWVVLAAAIATSAYSVPPARTKRWGLAANLTISLPRGLLLRVAGWAAVASIWYPEVWFQGLIFMIFTVGAASTKDFADVEGDRAAGCMTLPVKYGPLKAARIIAPFLYLPWILFPLASFIPLPSGRMLLTAPQLALFLLGSVLFLYGLGVSRLLVAEAGAAEAAKKRRSWIHMYLLMMIAQVGLAIVYLL